jgi:hypothetical protein
MKYLCLVLFFGVLDASAGGNYACEITGAFRVEPSGKPNAEVLSVFAGDRFTVDRATGQMSGALDNSFASGPIVVDHGSENSAYRAMNSMKSPVYDGTSFNLLVVEEYIVGKSKPFVYLDDEGVFYGTCERP